MKVLVTGASGFVGAHLVRALLKKKTKVFITARSTTNFWRIDELKSLFSGIYFTDLTNREETFKLVKDLQPEIIYHLAAYGGYPGQTNSEAIIQSNLTATVNLLDAAVDTGVEQFINTGSSSEYGIKNAPMQEDDYCKPVNLYGITKLAATNYCQMIGENLNYKVCTLRLFSPYGEYEAPNRLYPSIIEALKQDKQPILSNPDCVRDFIEIDKVIDVYLKIITKDYQRGGIYNVASGKQQTIREFYNKIATGLGKKEIQPLWNTTQSRTVEPQIWEANIDKLRTLLNE